MINSFVSSGSLAVILTKASKYMKLALVQEGQLVKTLGYLEQALPAFHNPPGILKANQIPLKYKLVRMQNI